MERLKRIWRLLREASGDDAFERYLVHHARFHPGTPPLTRSEFFRRETERKWNGVRRCC